MANVGFSGASFRRADLTRATLTEANLRQADLRLANLTETDCTRAVMDGAHLEGATLNRTILREAQLREANLRGVTLEGVDLAGADLRGAILDGMSAKAFDYYPPVQVIFEGAQMQGAKLRGAKLHGIRLSGVDLGQADLIGADLSNADLAGASLRGSDLRGADLTGAILDGCDLRDVQLESAKLTNALYDSRTKWPSELVPLLSGAKFYDLFQIPVDDPVYLNLEKQEKLEEVDRMHASRYDSRRLEPGAVVKVLAFHVDWAKVSTADGCTGFIRDPQFVQNLVAASGGEGIRIEGYARLMAGVMAGDEGPHPSIVIQLLAPGTMLRVDAVHSDWIKAQVLELLGDGATGFISVDRTDHVGETTGEGSQLSVGTPEGD